jgi:hypothetical protein
MIGSVFAFGPFYIMSSRVPFYSKSNPIHLAGYTHFQSSNKGNYPGLSRTKSPRTQPHEGHDGHSTLDLFDHSH